MTTHATAPVVLPMLKYSCGLCASGHHELCPGAIWNPGSGKVLVPAIGSTPATYEGEARWCPCQHSEHEGVSQAKCRVCGARRNHDELSLRLECLDAEDCHLAASARTESNPLYRMLQECQTTTVVAGEVKERPRRPTPQQRDQARAERKAAQSRPCTCGCEGVTKGGAFLPGHDARLVSQFAKAVHDDPSVADDARKLLADFPALLAKFEKRIAK